MSRTGSGAPGTTPTCPRSSRPRRRARSTSSRPGSSSSTRAPGSWPPASSSSRAATASSRAESASSPVAAARLRGGLGQLTSGAGQLEAGLALLSAGTGQLAFGLPPAPNGAGQLAPGLGIMQAAVIKARGQIPSTKDLETLMKQSPGMFSSGYFVLAAVEGARGSTATPRRSRSTCSAAAPRARSWSSPSTRRTIRAPRRCTSS